jgi:thiol-disulfide isomerase/thioredoxin
MATPLTSQNFDKDINLVGIQGPSVILFWSSGCPHCTAYHPVFEQAAIEAAKHGIPFFEVHTPDNQDLMQAIEAQENPKFVVNGIPTIVSYLDGQYSSTYGPGKNKKNFRSLQETLLFASTIGKSPIVYV